MIWQVISIYIHISTVDSANENVESVFRKTGWQTWEDQMCLSRVDKPLMGSVRAYMGRSAVLVGFNAQWAVWSECLKNKLASLKIKKMVWCDQHQNKFFFLSRPGLFLSGKSNFVYPSTFSHASSVQAIYRCNFDCSSRLRRRKSWWWDYTVYWPLCDARSCF